MMLRNMSSRSILLLIRYILADFLVSVVLVAQWQAKKDLQNLLVIQSIVICILEPLMNWFRSENEMAKQLNGLVV